MLRDNVRQLVKHTSIYSLGWIANMAAGVLLLPVYTRYLSVSDYGVVDLIQQTNIVIRILLATSFTYSVGRFFHDAKDAAEKSATIATCASSVLILAVFASIGCLIARNQMSVVLFGSDEFSNLVLVGSGIMLLDMAFLGLTYQYLVEKRSSAFVTLNLIKLVTGIIFNLVFIVGFELGGLGMLLGNVASYLPSCAIALTRCIRDHGLRIDWPIMKRLCIFGAPMVPATILATLMHSGDRFMLRPLGSLEQVGMFMMGLQFPAMLNSVLLTSFNSIWSGAVMFQLAKQKDGDYQISKIATYFMTVYVVLQTALAVFAAVILRVLVDPKFFPAIEVVPIACIGYSFHAIYTFFTSKAFTTGKPNRMILAYLIPLSIKIVLSLVLVSQFGYIASAWIMAITYLVFSITCFGLFRHLSTVHLEFGRLAVLFLSCVSAILISRLVRSDDLTHEFLTQLLIFGSLLAFLWLGPFLSNDERAQARREVAGLAARVTNNPTA